MLEKLNSVFLEEASDLLSSLEDNLLSLESDPENNELISAVFRVMHTIKGSAGMFGFDDISKFTHEIETAYDLVRSGKVKVTSEQLDEVKINGSGDFEQLGEMKTESMTVSIVGSGDVKMNNVNCTGLLKTQVTGSGDLAVQQATCARAEVSISGSGDVKLHRLKSATLKGSIKGSGDIDALDFVAKNIAVKVRGAGDVRCHATELLDLRSANMDNVSYKGNPRIIGKGRIE